MSSRSGSNAEESQLGDAGFDLHLKRDQDAHHHVVECYILYDFHQAAGPERFAQRLEGRVADRHVHSGLECVAHHDTFLLVEQRRGLELVQMLKLFARDTYVAREVPMMGELILRAGESSDRHQREFAQLGIEFGPIAKLASEGEEAPQQIRRMRDDAKDVTDRIFPLLDQAIENFAVLFRKVFTTEIR